MTLPSLSMTYDELLARQLQDEENQQEKQCACSSLSIDMEPFDPFPHIHALFQSFNEAYFWNKLLRVEVQWSQKMTLCAGLCYYETHTNFCSIRLSEPLLKFRSRKDLINTLLVSWMNRETMRVSFCST
jgi:hypothetical protein